jgi:glycosyltransferase involved in cell wall biosynthesis
VSVLIGGGEAGALLSANAIPVFLKPSLNHRKRSIMNFIKGIFELIAIVRRLRPDIIHAHHYYCANQAVIAASVSGTKVVFTVHSDIAFKTRLPHIVGNRIIAVSESTKQSILSRGLARGKSISVIPNGSEFLGLEDYAKELPQFRELSGKAELTFVATYVGRLVEAKGVDIFLAAAAAIKNDVPILCCIVGTGPSGHELKIRSKDLGISSIFFGEVPDVKPILELSNVVVIPSLRWEGMPMLLLEAGVLGKPVIATRTGGIPEIIEDGVSGLLVDTGDSDGLGDALRRIYHDHTFGERLGMNLKKSVLAKNSVDAMVNAVIAVYQTLVGG